MSGRLPQTVHPGRLADAGETLRGRMRLVSMPRLADSLHDTEGEVEVELEFGVDGQRLRHVQGRLRATLPLLCQRCLQPMMLPLDVEMRLGLVASEAAAKTLDAARDPLIVEDDRVDLRELVEDELLLALPIVPMHAIDDCGFDRETIVIPESGAAPQEDPETRRPFEGLSNLIRNGK